MTSKNLFFKLMKENLRSRIWAFALFGIGFFFFCPVAAAFLAGEIQDYPSYEQGLLWYRETIQTWLSCENGMMVLVMTAVALVCGLSGFSYLNSRSKVDFYHSLPVRREWFYAVNVADGILILAVPYAVCLILGVIVAIANGAESSVIVPVSAAAFGVHMTYFVLIYMTVITAVMLTGNMIVGILGFMVLAGIVPLASSMVEGYFSTFFQTYAYEVGGELFAQLRRISPIGEYIMQVGKYGEGRPIAAGVATAWVASLLLAGFNLWVYRKRPSESAGKAMAFPVSCPIIRIPLAVTFGLGLALMFWNVRKSTGWAVFGVICGVILVHGVIEIIYHFDFRQMFANRGQLVVCLLAATGLLFVFRYDPFGYNSYLPSASRIKSGAVWVRQLGGWVDYGTAQKSDDGSWTYQREDAYRVVLGQMHSEDIENILALATAGIDQTKEYFPLKDGPRVVYETMDAGNSDSGDPDADAAKSIYQVMVAYEMKNGRKIYRQYWIDLDTIPETFNRLLADEQFQKATFPLLSQDASSVDTILFRADRTRETALSKLTEAQKKEFLETYKKEFSSLTLDRLEKEAPIGLIRFATEKDCESIEWQRRQEQEKKENLHYSYYSYHNYNEFVDLNYYPVYPSFTETISLLKAQGIDLASRKEKADIQSIQIQKYRNDGYQTIIITDPAEIEELRSVLTEPRMLYYNRLYRASSLNVTLTVVEDGETQEYDVQFPRGQVPKLVLDRLSEAKIQ